MLIVSTEDDPRKAEPAGDVFLASWASPEFAASVAGSRRQCRTLNSVIGSFPALTRDVHTQVQKTLDQLPIKYRGVRPLEATTLIDDAYLPALAAAHLLKAAPDESDGGTALELMSASDFGIALETVSRALGGPPILLRRPDLHRLRHHSRSHLQRLWALAREARLNYDPAQLFWAPLEYADRDFSLRQRIWRRARASFGGTYCYSSYVNYSHNLSLHAAHMSTPPNWVVNKRSARPQSRRFSYLWQFKGTSSRPLEHRDACDALRSSLLDLPNDAGDLPMREIARTNSIFLWLTGSVFPALLTEIDLMEAFLEQTRPSELWVANQWGSEGLLLPLARNAGTPTVQVQHGTLESYYAFAPIVSDRFLVWGDLWRTAVNPAERSKVEVMNPGLEVASAAGRRPKGGHNVTFFTAPVDLLPFWNPLIVLWEGVTLVGRLLEMGADVTVRIHPMDRIDTWRSAWRKQVGALPSRLRFEKGGPLEPLLEWTDVAIVFHSTVFLNCAASGIPVVALSWYPSMWREELEEAQLVHFADSIQDAAEMALSLNRSSRPAPNVQQALAPEYPSEDKSP